MVHTYCSPQPVHVVAALMKSCFSYEAQSRDCSIRPPRGSDRAECYQTLLFAVALPETNRRCLYIIAIDSSRCPLRFSIATEDLALLERPRFNCLLRALSATKIENIGPVSSCAR